LPKIGKFRKKLSLNLPFLKWFNFWLETISFIISAKIFLAYKKFDIYYTRDFLVAAFLKRENTKIIYEIHSLPESGIWLHKKAWARADYLVVISEGLRRALLAYGIPAHKIILARDAVDLSMFSIKESKESARAILGLPINKKLVVYTGHLYDWKGASLLAASAEFLPSVEIFLVGGTRGDLDKFKTLYKFKNLHLIGWQPQVEIPLWLKAADILVLPNSAREKIGSEYTSPLKLFEYMASGTPIIASCVPALEEVLDKSDAIFFEPDNLNSLVQAIESSLADPSKLKKLALSALSKATQFTWGERANLIIKSCL